jgi:DNA-binding transcriptional regulator YiaG
MSAPYHYKISGIEGLRLVGISVLQCKKCHDERPLIPHPAGLHRAIALALIKKPLPLRGDELRFIRKEAELPQGEFAALLGVSQEHISRFENDHTKRLSDTAERWARALLVAVLKEGEAIREALLEIARTKMNNKFQRGIDYPIFIKFIDNNRWEAAAA